MLIRPFRPTDLPTLKRITVAAFDGVSIDQGMQKLFGPIHGHDWQWRKARHLDEDVARDPSGIFVAEIDGRIIGTGELGPVTARLRALYRDLVASCA